MATSATRSNRAGITRLTLAALFAALMAAGTFISVPLPFSPVPLVLQNLFMVLAGLVLGPALGCAAAALYLLAGALGLPVFAGAAGGIAHFAGPTGGFLAGYFLAALTAGFIAGKPHGKKTPLPRIVLAAAAGFLVVYAPGVVWLRHILHSSWPVAFAAGLLPFLPGDAVKCVIAILAAPRLRRIAADRLS